MYQLANNKRKKNNNQSGFSTEPEGQSGVNSGFLHVHDSRREAIIQRRQQSIMNESPQLNKAMQFKEMAEANVRTQKLLAIQKMANDSFQSSNKNTPIQGKFIQETNGPIELPEIVTLLKTLNLRRVTERELELLVTKLDSQEDIHYTEASDLWQKIGGKLGTRSIPEFLGLHEDSGLVPPSDYDRDTKYITPQKPQNSKGKLHAVSAKDLNRSERMMNRIGRLITQEENVHVAVAMDGNAMVISSNKEEEAENLKLESVIDQLINNLQGAFDPLLGFNGFERHHNVPEGKITGDLKKVDRLMKGDYTGEDGIEMDPEVNAKLVKIKAALEAGLINREQYMGGATGVYVITTPMRGRTFNMHGELKVTDEIKARRERSPEEEHQDVFVGGTWLDCFACNASHKISNETLAEQEAGWKFYSGGTHGGMFPYYRLTDDVLAKKERFEELTGEQVTGEDRQERVNAVVIPPDRQVHYDSDSEDEDYDVLKFDRKRAREREKGGSTFEEDTSTVKEKVEEQKAMVATQEGKVRKSKRALADAEDQIGRLDGKRRHAANLIKDAKERKEQLNAEGGGTFEDAKAEYLAEQKEEIESELKKGPRKGRKVNWDGAKWVPDNWVPRGRSEQLMKRYQSTQSVLQGMEGQFGRSNESNNSKLESLTKSIQDSEKIVRELKLEIAALQEKMEEIKLRIVEEEKTLIGIRENANRAMEELKSSYSQTHGLTYDAISIPESDRDRIKEHMDHFQHY